MLTVVVCIDIFSYSVRCLSHMDLTIDLGMIGHTT